MLDIEHGLELLLEVHEGIVVLRAVHELNNNSFLLNVYVVEASDDLCLMDNAVASFADFAAHLANETFLTDHYGEIVFL